ncbi:hypothetical protein ACIF70_35460 [Actinacidiphila glaucinigra]|uniref:hypothetical protein n=1 Tax=Actinacidiphila glaucinigra TaxID=235986 RepID=UPI002DD7BB0B|nr:hypothetical protein [Actinacidiphila glaucinigra]WSD57767.1 hypothetical protein OIE69_01945 [Actinacidiphila glaucinigra]
MFTLADGIGVSPLEWWEGEAPEGTIDGRTTMLGRLRGGEQQFAYVFDMGDQWARLCTVDSRRVDPEEEFGVTPDRPMPAQQARRPCARDPLALAGADPDDFREKLERGEGMPMDEFFQGVEHDFDTSSKYAYEQCDGFIGGATEVCEAVKHLVQGRV